MLGSIQLKINDVSIVQYLQMKMSSEPVAMHSGIVLGSRNGLNPSDLQ